MASCILWISSIGQAAAGMTGLVAGDALPAARSLTRPFCAIVMHPAARSTPHHIMVRKEEDDMPRYILPLLQSGVMRPCEPSSRLAKASWLGPFLRRWFGLSRADTIAVLPVRR